MWCWSPCCLSLSPSLPLCPYPACPPLVCPCPAPASSRLSLPLSLFCPGPILLCPQLHPACLAPVCLRFVFCPSLLWPHPACPHSILPHPAHPCPHPACARLDLIFCPTCLFLPCLAVILSAPSPSRPHPASHTQNVAPGWSGRCHARGHPASFRGRVSSVGIFPVLTGFHMFWENFI